MLSALLLAAVAGHACPIDRAEYVLRGTPQITAHFERAPKNDDWQAGIVLVIRGANTGHITYWLPWPGGTDDGRHVRRTELYDPHANREAQQRKERRGDLDFFTTNSSYGFLSSPMLGDEAPAHLLIPMLGNVLWHSTVNVVRDSAPRAFFDLIGCHRPISRDRGMDVILPGVA